MSSRKNKAGMSLSSKGDHGLKKAENYRAARTLAASKTSKVKFKSGKSLSTK